MTEAFFKTKRHELIIAAILLLPLLYLNVRDSQHWGDDFSVYIHQAVNIAEGENFSETGFVYEPGFTPLPPSGTVGFSLLLVPVYKIFGLNMFVFSFFQACLFVIWALLAFYFFRIHFGFGSSLVFLIVACYSNFMLWLKLLITSDVSFSIMLLLIVIWLSKIKQHHLKAHVGVGGLLAIAISTRSVGWVILPAFWFYTVYRIWKNSSISNRKIKIRNLLGLTASTFVVYYIFNRILFKPALDYIGDAVSLFQWRELPHTFLKNAIHYTQNYLDLFRSTDVELQLVSIIFSFCVLAFTITGWLTKVMKRPQFFDFVVVCYVGFIFSFPVISDYRYIAPVHVFVLLYLFTGMKILADMLPIKMRAPLQIAFVLFTLFIYKDHLKYLWIHGKETLPGPYDDMSQQAFSYLKKNIADDDLIVFNKPRALTLYTDKRTTMPSWDNNNEENYLQLKTMGAKYYLYSPMIVDEQYQDLIEKKKSNFRERYKNWQFTLYEDTTLPN